MKGRLLVIDDDQSMCDLLEHLLGREGYRVKSFTSAHDALQAVTEEEYDAVLTDVGLPDVSGLELCQRIIGTRPGLPVVVVTGQANMETAVGSIRVGAYDFLTKPIDGKLLTISVARAVQHHRLTEEVARLRSAAAVPRTDDRLIGSSAPMRRVLDLVDRVAPSEASVLVQGETGTGKELVARLIHDSSPRREGPFVALNCAAVPQSLIESELFGHVRGAFTDAKNARTGLFAQADGGTFFLDEIGELPPDVQAKLLRSLQERKVRPVGSNLEVPFDARIVAATNRNLEDEVYEKRFREDLYYRINVVKIMLPALRDRGGDVLLLAQHFLGQLAPRSGKPDLKLSMAAAEKLMAYNWPGNVRELENCMERAVALARFDQITVEDLPDRVRAYQVDRFVLSANDLAEVLPLSEIERRYVLRVLSLLGGNKTRAAHVLGLDRRTLYRKLERYADGPIRDDGEALPSFDEPSHDQ